MRTLFVLSLLSLFGLAFTAGCTPDDTPQDVVESDAEADQDIEATFDTASDLALDSGDEDLKEVDDSSTTADGETDADIIQDTAPQHTKIQGNIETRETCSDVCTANGLACDDLRTHVFGAGGGDIEWGDVGALLQCDDVPEASTNFNGQSYDLTRYVCYCRPG